jgi:hypothetical protein
MAEHSPWGEVQGSEQIAHGIRQVFTAGHGGVVVSPTRMRQMPAPLADVGRRLPGRAGYGYFEEDCDWAAVAVAFPDAYAAHFAGRDIDIAAHAVAALRDYNPDAYEAHFGRTIPAGASTVKDDRAFDARHRPAA